MKVKIYIFDNKGSRKGAAKVSCRPTHLQWVLLVQACWPRVVAALAPGRGVTARKGRETVSERWEATALAPD